MVSSMRWAKRRRPSTTKTTSENCSLFKYLGPESISFARGRWQKCGSAWMIGFWRKIWFLRCRESNFRYKQISKIKYGLEHISHRNVQNGQQQHQVITMYHLQYILSSGGTSKNPPKKILIKYSRDIRISQNQKLSWNVWHLSLHTT